MSIISRVEGQEHCPHTRHQAAAVVRATASVYGGGVKSASAAEEMQKSE
jgi:heptaprenylglyceryl phosphate synthase